MEEGSEQEKYPNQALAWGGGFSTRSLLRLEPCASGDDECLLNAGTPGAGSASSRMVLAGRVWPNEMMVMWLPSDIQVELVPEHRCGAGKGCGG